MTCWVMKWIFYKFKDSACKDEIILKKERKKKKNLIHI